MSPSGANPPDVAASSGAAHIDENHRFRLLIATDAGFDPIVRAATTADQDCPQLVLFGADATFPFRPRPSTILVSGMPAGVIACVPQLDEFGIASRLASTAGLPGCYDGSVIELAEAWLNSHAPSPPVEIEILVSAGEETVRAVEDLGRRLGISVGEIST